MGATMHARATRFHVAIRVRSLALLLALGAAYLQGGLAKPLDFPGAIAEVHHFSLSPGAPSAMMIIVLELGASALIFAGYWRRLGAPALAAFSIMASLLANAFWNVPMPERIMVEDAFFKHIGLAGRFMLVVWHDPRHLGKTGLEHGG